MEDKLNKLDTLFVDLKTAPDNDTRNKKIEEIREILDSVMKSDEYHGETKSRVDNFYRQLDIEFNRKRDDLII